MEKRVKVLLMVMMAVLVSPVRDEALDGTLDPPDKPAGLICRDSASVIVRSEAAPLPKSKSALNALLSEEYINGPAPRLFDCPVHSSPGRAACFVRSLVRAATEDDAPTGIRHLRLTNVSSHRRELWAMPLHDQPRRRPT